MQKITRIIVLILVTFLILSLSGCNKDPVEITDENGPKEGGEEMVLEQLNMPKAGEEIAVITTNFGEIRIRLFPEVAPKAVENFKTHAQNGYYDGISFHRVIKDFMIQGGDPEGTGRGGESIWGAPFEDEFDIYYHNFRGAL
ncbi:MAG: peptidylprolyl isomerase, partial [Tissierellia bacterium]|nr:peptidylprolyl isomerase [Tissierellia bacterium]